MEKLRTSDVVYPELSYKLNGVFFAVHNSLGRFRNEKQYSDALESELKNEGISYEREKSLPQSFSGEADRRNVPDFIVEDRIIVDVKAKRLITKDDYFQMQRYLSSCGGKPGIVVNFRQKFLTPKRIICKSNSRHSHTFVDSHYV